jgi:pimeloyl-ACP methyl ester carboxylesterase
VSRDEIVQDYGLSDRPLYELIGREALALLAAGLLMPFGAGRFKRKVPRRELQRTVVFVHGYFSNAATFFPLRAYLRARGIKQALFFNYRSSRGVEAGARALKEFLRKHVKGGRVDLVCHSMGGMVARTYLQDLGGHRRVDRCITLATPHRGTYAAYWILSRVGRELRPDSELIRRLTATRKVASRVQFVSLVAGSDHVVIPRVFSANEETIRVADVGHLGLLFSPMVFRKVGDLLASGRPVDKLVDLDPVKA